MGNDAVVEKVSEKKTKKEPKEKKPSMNISTGGLNVNSWYKMIFDKNANAKLSDMQIGEQFAKDFPLKGKTPASSYIAMCRRQYNKGALQGDIQNGKPTQLPEFVDGKAVDKEAIALEKKEAAAKLRAQKKLAGDKKKAEKGEKNAAAKLTK